jgi:hypothetical protein
MPLPAPAARQPIHTRQIKLQGYERDDGLFDIEAHLSDTKAYAFRNKWRGSIEAGEALHEMLLRLTIDTDFVVHDVVAATDHSPFAVCPEITDRYRQLIGLRIGPGWRKAIRERVGGVKGCTHLTELLMPMATVAIQTIRPLQNHRRHLADSDASADRKGRPFVLDTCHAWATHSPVVRDNAPDYYQPLTIKPAPEEAAE